MIKAILLDCGGVLVAPATGDWVLSPGYEAILGEAFMTAHFEDFRRVRPSFLHLLPDVHRIDTDEEEFSMFIPYYEAVFAAIGAQITREQVTALAKAQVFDDARYILFDDVLPYLELWRTRYKLGIVSDAPPSTRRIMDRVGVTERIDGATYSCEVGVLKPDPAIYQSTLDRLSVATGDAVFVDDMPSKLQGAKDLGIQCVQMRRPMPPLFPISPLWDGHVVHSFAELDQLLPRL